MKNKNKKITLVVKLVNTIININIYFSEVLHQYCNKKIESRAAVTEMDLK